ncbi:nuclear transport factor 2 family protein [Nonomuraea sp. NPDC050310]|uniref:nuclear transport factor 2 family protein n=1 Tax=unclassified Nonomuraea TaxID=2593643 RepID=UPI0033EF1B6B
MITKNLLAVRESYAASARGDVAGVLAALAPDARWTEMAGFPCAGTYVGPDEVLKGVFARLGEEWEGFAAEPEEYVDAGDVIVVIGVYRGVYRATGKAMQARFTHVWKLYDGTVIGFEQFTDTLLVARAMQP